MSDIDKALEQLLSKAAPRAVPNPTDTAAAREAIRSEWRAVSGRRKSRSTVLRFAVAATVLIGLFSIFNGFRVAETELVRVASIQKSFGPIYVLSDQSELIRANDLASIHAGQVIVTGDDAGIALAWAGGGSMRVDESSEIEFRDDNTVYLRSGKIYFDSTPSKLVAGTSVSAVGSFEIETDHGVVSHTGTQFMTGVNDDELLVRVREGRVEIAGRYYPHTAERGEQVVISGRQRPVVLSIPEYGALWDWVSRTSPAVDVDGKTIHEFLSWAGRELGMSVKYGNDELEQLVREKTLKGQVDTEPGEALRMRMLTAGLTWNYEEGAIHVSDDH